VARPKPETREVETSTLGEEFATGEILLGALPAPVTAVNPEPVVLVSVQKAIIITSTSTTAKPSLKKPKVQKRKQKTKLELLLFIQSRIRAFLARVAYKRLIQA
jgi:hypothetical protein